jgi:hypothetical protein
MDAEKMMEHWMSAGVHGFGDLQKAFMDQFAKAQSGSGGGSGAAAKD